MVCYRGDCEFVCRMAVYKNDSQVRIAGVITLNRLILKSSICVINIFFDFVISQYDFEFCP